jgi:protein-tyrosine-phosphatase
MSGRVYNVLFLCTGNNARSIMAESILRKDGGGGFRSFSAGSQLKGVVNPFALKVLRAADYPTDRLRSKNWQEFAAPDAPVMDFVFTVCDNAAGEACPLWPGQPMTAHWGIEDPAVVEGTDIQKEAAFVTVRTAFPFLFRCRCRRSTRSRLERNCAKSDAWTAPRPANRKQVNGGI